MIIAHLTSAHPRYDIRIFMKECCSLAQAGYNVHLIVADGKGGESVNSVTFHDVGGSSSRLDRMFNTTRRVYKEALRLNADVYHIHDPELLVAGLKLKLRGKKVIFDAHEDLPKQIMGKPYLGRFSRVMLSSFFKVFEKKVCSRFDLVIGATPWITEKFKRINPLSVTINNYPMVGELAAGDISWKDKRREVSYIGGISAIRGIRQVVGAMGHVKSGARLQLGGGFSDKKAEALVKSDRGWASVDSLGFLSREQVREALARSVGGLVTFLPAPNHIDAQPNKMFEYMSAGVPVIASHFPLWKEIIEGNACGLCVDPLSPLDIAHAIDYLVNNPNEAELMGRSGQQAVLEKYNWAVEEKVLLAAYRKLAERTVQ